MDGSDSGIGLALCSLVRSCFGACRCGLRSIVRRSRSANRPVSARGFCLMPRYTTFHTELCPCHLSVNCGLWSATWPMPSRDWIRLWFLCVADALYKVCWCMTAERTIIVLYIMAVS